MMRLINCSLLFLILLHSGFRSRVREKTPFGLLLGPPQPVQESSYYEEITHYRGQKAAWERAKADYLIERIRTSPLTFIRNGDSYPGREAAAHIAWKYRIRGKKVEDARDFIKYFATRSSETGKPYLVQTPDGKVYQASDILYNELRILNEQLMVEK